MYDSSVFSAVVILMVVVEANEFVPTVVSIDSVIVVSGIICIWLTLFGSNGAVISALPIILVLADMIYKWFFTFTFL